MFKYEIIDGEVAITGYKDKTVTHIDIPEFIDGYPVISITNGGFYNCGELVSVNIPNSVVRIGSESFFTCLSLKSINNIDLVFGINFIGDKFIYQNTFLFSIIYGVSSQICSDYVCCILDKSNRYSYKNSYYIDGELRNKTF